MAFETAEQEERSVLGHFTNDFLRFRICYSHTSIICEEEKMHFRVPLFLPSHLPSDGSRENWQMLLSCCFGKFLERRGLEVFPKLTGGGICVCCPHKIEDTGSSTQNTDPRDQIPVDPALRGIDKKRYMREVKALRLHRSMDRLQFRTVKNAIDRILGNGSRVKGALRSLFRKLGEQPKSALVGWKKYVIEVNKARNRRAARILRLLERVPLRILKDANDRIYGDGNKAKGVIRSLVRKLGNRPKDALVLWRRFVDDVKTGRLLNTVKVLSQLERIPLRTMKDANDRILGDSSKVIGVVRLLMHRLSRRPRLVLTLWSQYVQSVKKGKLLDEIKAQKVRKALSHIPMRTLREATDRVMGNGDRIKGILRSLVHNGNQRPKTALGMWKANVEDTKKFLLQEAEKAKIMTQLKTYDFCVILKRVSTRTLRDAHFRLLGDGSKLKGAIRSLLHHFVQRPKSSLFHWRKYVDRFNSNKIMNLVKAQKLKSIFEHLTRCETRPGFNEITGKGDKFYIAIRSLTMILNAGMQRNFDKWKTALVKTEVELESNKVLGAKLQYVLHKIIRRPLRAGFPRKYEKDDDGCRLF